MSRSYKKTPIWKDGSSNNLRFQKRLANKKVRRAKDVPNGKAYRRIYDTWNIHDCVIKRTFIGWMRRAEGRYLQYMNGGDDYSRWSRSGFKDQNYPPDFEKERNEYRKTYYWK